MVLLIGVWSETNHNHLNRIFEEDLFHVPTECKMTARGTKYIQVPFNFDEKNDRGSRIVGIIYFKMLAKAGVVEKWKTLPSSRDNLMRCMTHDEPRQYY